MKPPTPTVKEQHRQHQQHQHSKQDLEDQPNHSQSTESLRKISEKPAVDTSVRLLEHELYMSQFENIIAKGKEPNMLKCYKPKASFERPKYLSPQELKNLVMKSPKIKSLIDIYAERTNTNHGKVEEQVKKIIEEIGLDRSLFIIRACGMAITAIGKRICSGIFVNSANMEKVKEKLGPHQVLYLPSHRSYMDFILMSYICFYYNIEIPGIAAGMDFHSMFGMGTMLRKTGAFFMRRSFSNDELYWDVFQEYMYALVASYHIGVEFFIEGTRSRNFKALVPKVGLLSMALLPYFCGKVSDITIVPVSVTYERVLEEQLFVYELLGVPKPKETTKGFLKALKIIDERFGKMFMDFGEPISVKEFFNQTGIDRLERAGVAGHVQKLNKNEIELVKKLANEVVYQQQCRIVITTFNLLCLFYAKQLYSKKLANIDEIAEGIIKLKKLFEQLGAHVATDINCIKPEILKTVEIHSNVVHFRNANLQFTQIAPSQLVQEIDVKRLKAHSLAPQIMAVAVPTLALQLYINPCLFWLARPAYILIAALQLQKEQMSQLNFKGSLIEIIHKLEEKTYLLEDIFRHEFIIDANRIKEEFMRNTKILEENLVLRMDAENGRLLVNDNEFCHIILSALAPFLCMYYQLAATLKELPANTEFSNKDILIRMQQRIENLLQESDASFVHPYCLALDNLNIAIQSFIQNGYLMKNKSNNLLRLPNDIESLHSFEKNLYNYCQLLPFHSYHEATNLQITTNWNLSKL